MTLNAQRVAVGSAVHTAEWLISTRAGQAVLAASRNSEHRPRCMCVPGGVEMYIGKRSGAYYLARMPGTGFLHADDCVSVNDAMLFSGAEAYAPGATVELGDGTLSLATRLDRRERQADPITEVSIDGLLDTLVELADLNRISPGATPRTWLSVRNRLIDAARWVRLGDVPVAEIMFLPDRYARDTGAASLAECESFLKSNSGPALICAPLKELRLTTHSWQIVLKHLPGLRLWASKDAVGEIEGRWGAARSHFVSPPTFALCLVAAKAGRRDGNYTVTNMACLPTNANYLPCCTEREDAIAAQLLEEGASLLRPLRFDCDPAQPLADFAILAGETPHPVFVLAPSGNHQLDAAKRSLAGLMQRNHACVRIFSNRSAS